MPALRAEWTVTSKNASVGIVASNSGVTTIAVYQFDGFAGARASINLSEDGLVEMINVLEDALVQIRRWRAVESC